MRTLLKALGLTILAASLSALSMAHGTGTPHGAAKPREIKVAVTEKGFVPSSIKVKAGQPVVLAITRKTDKTCATEAVFPSLDRTFELPLNQTVRVELHPDRAGRIAFACGMNMIKAQVVVQ
jgi:plastocyanin domain-containing protein